LVRNVKSILEELEQFPIQRDKNDIVASRASNIIHSAINLIEFMNEMYSPEIAAELEKRLLAAIRLRDKNKFLRKTKELKNANK